MFSPSQLVAFSLCRHLLTLERAVARGERTAPERPDAEMDLFARRGREHEASVLAAYEAEGRRVAQVMVAGEGRDALERGAALTLEAMRGGAEVIAQARFFDGRWTGVADFLLRREGRPSALGDYSYEPADAKLARHVRPAVVLQLCSYAEQLAAVQGIEPENLHVVLGDGTTRAIPYASVAAFYRRTKETFESAVEQGLGETYPDPTGHCAACRWAHECDARRRGDDHLTLVADLRREQEARLAAAGIRTVEALASRPAASVRGVGSATLARLTAQARLQVEQRRTGQVTWERLPVEAGRGLLALPTPSAGDVFFDIESDPLVPGGLEYLFGVVDPSGGAPVYRALWAHDRAAEKRAFEAFVDQVTARLAAHPDMHVYHYGAYEPAALTRLMGVHGTRERELDAILRGQVLVDLHRVVRHGVRVSQESYSIKMLEPLYRDARTTAVAGGLSSVAAYEQWREDGVAQRLEEIEAYNRDDCHSLAGLRDWLEARRAEVERAEGPLPRPAPLERAPSAPVAAAEAAEDEVTAALLAGEPAEAQVLLGHLVGWHRREAKPEWWMWFHRRRLGLDELFEDTEALAGLEYAGVAGKGHRSLTHEYRFDPQQEHRIGPGDKPDDPVTGLGVGEVVSVDNMRGLLRIKRSAFSDKPHPRALIPGGPLETSAQRDALLRIGRWVAAQGLDARGPYRAVRDLLLRRPPRVRTGRSGGPLVAAGEDPGDAAVRLALALDQSCLAVQGPPGSGKTRTGARLVLELARAGRRLGVTANSHKAITNLLDELCRTAERAGHPLAVVQKASDEERRHHPMVRQAANNAEVEAALRAGQIEVLAGTPWLFAREALEGTLDTLVVEEAGQLSLANVVAIGGAARNFVLLGDPRQLSQPSKASHPPGAERSALEHLLGEHETIPPELGVFLATTRRMHPDLARYVSETFYDGRLAAHESCAAQALGGAPPLCGAGLRYVPVEHAGNRTASVEEVAAVSALVGELVGQSFTGRDGQVRALEIGDVLVVAPYNAQVARLTAALPAGARVGTVDKFQGQQAPVVIYSMAASSSDDVPRGLEFLFSPNRLNVALSRAQALAVLVCSPALLQPACRTVEHVRLANALCRLVELAGEPAVAAAAVPGHGRRASA